VALYMPYLHGKQEELMALVSMSPSLGELVVPIIKPVNVDLSRTVGRLARISADSRLALIMNSDKGPNRRPPTYGEATGVLSSPRLKDTVHNVLPAFELRGGTPLAEFERFSQDFADRICVVVHKRHTYSAAELQRVMHFSQPPVHVYIEPGVSATSLAALPSRANLVLRDGFSSCERNALYPAQSAFDDLAYQYQARHFAGFGDFCMIGDSYSATGGPARAVALHLTEDRGSELIMNHLVSTAVGVDVATMYFEALELLSACLGTPVRDDLDTQGSRMYVESRRNRQYHGLGLAKRWSIMHHLEIVLRILVSQGTAPAF